VGKVANLTRKDFEELKMNPHISSIEDDEPVTIAALTPYPELILSSLGQPSGESVPWGIEKVRAGDVPSLPDGFDPIKVCVVDTGYGLGHPDLPQANVTGTDTVSGKWDEDGHGHGTHCAGTIGAIGGNDEGVVGVIKSPLEFTFHIGKGLSNSGSGSTSGVLAAVQGCAEAGAKVISMSLGGGGFSQAAHDAYKNHYNDGILVIAAAGNGGNSAYSYPASYPHVMSVAATDSGNNKAGFSQYNDQVEIAAPGVCVMSSFTS
jgi:serine protease